MIVDCELTQEDLDIGKIKTCKYCPYARSINRVLNGKCKIGIMRAIGEIIDYSSLLKPYAIQLPLEVQRNIYIIDWQDKDKVKPHKYKLEIPKEYLKQAA